MRIPDPRDYDFLWLVKGQPYFETSLILLNQEYMRRDFLITSRAGDSKTYVGKGERRRLARYGLLFLKKRLRGYERLVQNKTAQAHRGFRTAKSQRLQRFSNSQLVKEFLRLAEFVNDLWRWYFFTEYFLHDEVERRIEKHPERARTLKKRVEEMQKIKFRFRTVLNPTVFGESLFTPYLQEIERRTHHRNLHDLHYREVAALLTEKKRSRVERTDFVVGQFSQWRPITGPRARAIITKFDRALLQGGSVQELRGQVAHRGYHKGRVKIIPFDLKENLTQAIAKMRKGNVLITGSTGPEMILACKKAGAIVTEEGGIASHAAIVSRELGIPCIIATKIATQVFQDGDRVEVDAERGVVRKI